MNQNQTTKSLSPSEYERIGRIAVEFGERIDPSSGDGPFIRVPMIDVDLVRGSVSEVGKGGIGRSRSFTDHGNNEFQPGDRVRVKAGASRAVSPDHVGKTFIVKSVHDDHSHHWIAVDTGQGPWAFADYLLEKVECGTALPETAPRSPLETATSVGKFTHVVAMPMPGSHFNEGAVSRLQKTIDDWMRTGGALVLDDRIQLIFGDYLPFAASVLAPGSRVRLKDSPEVHFKIRGCEATVRNPPDRKVIDIRVGETDHPSAYWAVPIRWLES